MEAQTDSTSFQFWTPGTARTKMDAQVAYEVGFGRSLYGWKDNFKTLQMAPLSGAATPSFGLWALYRVGAH